MGNLGPNEAPGLLVDNQANHQEARAELQPPAEHAEHSGGEGDGFFDMNLSEHGNQNNNNVNAL